jgi:hypothetical protein
MGGDGAPTTPVREGPPGRRIDGTKSSFGGVASGGSGGNVSSALEDRLLGRDGAEGCVD